MNRWMTLGVVIALIGCGDDDAPTEDMGPVGMDMGPVGMDMPPVLDMDTGSDADAYDRVQAAQGRAAAASCACDLQEIETEALCVAFQTIPTEVADCEDASYRASLAAAAPSFTCQADAFEAYATCFEGAGCDETTIDGCVSTVQAALMACPELPDTVFGDDLDACIATNVLGDMSACPEGDDSSALGDSVFSGNSLMAGWDFRALSCAEDGEAAPDRAFSWTAPEAGAFTFDTAGSEFDTLIAILDGCEGDELACNDDSDDVGPLRSSATVILEADQTVTVVVSGYDFTSYGAFQVNIAMEELTEPDAAALTRTRSALDAATAIQCACDFAPFADAAECEAFGATPAGYLTCEDTAFTDNFAGAGSQVTCGAIVAEEYEACLTAASCDDDMTTDCVLAFAFNEDCLPTPAAYDDAIDACVDTTIVGTTASTCPAVAASSATGMSVFSGTTVLAADDVASSCGSAAGGAADQVYEWVAPSAGMFVIDTAGSSFDTVLSTLDACGGTEVDCNDDADEGDIGSLSRLTVDVAMDESVFIVVDGFGARSAGDFVVNINPAL